MSVHSFYYDEDYIPAMPIIEIGVSKPNGKREAILTALVDSGADASMIPINILDEIGARFIKHGRVRPVLGAGERAALYGVTIRIGSYQLYGIQAIATAEGSEILVGRDVLNHLIVTLNGLAHETEITG